jgi:hypothetical protein
MKKNIVSFQLMLYLDSNYLDSYLAQPCDRLRWDLKKNSPMLIFLITEKLKSQHKEVQTDKIVDYMVTVQINKIMHAKLLGCGKNSTNSS